MKTMNYLFLMTLLVFSNSCTNYSPLGDNGSGEESEGYHLELDFHQGFLVWEEQQIRDEIVSLEEEIENGGKGHEQLEVLQGNLERNITDYQLNGVLLDKYFKGPIGGIKPGKPCGAEPSPVFRCPIPKKSIGKLFLYKDQWQKGAIEVLTIGGEICGEMVGMEPVSGGDEQFSLAIIEFDSEVAAQMRFTKLSDSGELLTYIIPIE